jgi:hypothetical protein
MEYINLVLYLLLLIFCSSMLVYDFVYLHRAHKAAQRLGIDISGFLKKSLKINVGSSLTITVVIIFCLLRILGN